MATHRPERRLHESLAEIVRLLERHRVLDTLAHRQEGPRRDLVENLQRRQNVAELNKRLRAMHAADVAYVLESLPVEDRVTVWDELAADRAGAVFVEVSDAVRESLVEAMPRSRLVEVLASLDPEDLGYVSPSLPEDVLDEVSRALASSDRSVFEESIRYPETCVGHHMTREWVEVLDTKTVGDALAELRRRGELPAQTDHLFVVDARHLFVGAVPLQALLVHDPATRIVGIMRDGDSVATFGAHADVDDAVAAFERYDLVSAPVLDDRGKLVGRLAVDAVMDVLREESNLQALRSAGLSRGEDLFAGPMDSARNRWPWLAINLVTAFIASRVIGQFEGVIERLAALAALMPIVASIGGNTGNQTMALVVRALAMDQIGPSGSARLLRKELAVSLLNGSLWGLLVGLFAVLFYAHAGLGLVMSGAVVLNLLVAAAAGVLIPMGLHAAGRDPAHGSSVLLTFVTDAMGFFLFLGLAAVFLV